MKKIEWEYLENTSFMPYLLLAPFLSKSTRLREPLASSLYKHSCSAWWHLTFDSPTTLAETSFLMSSEEEWPSMGSWRSLKFMVDLKSSSLLQLQPPTNISARIWYLFRICNNVKIWYFSSWWVDTFQLVRSSFTFSVEIFSFGLNLLVSDGSQIFTKIRRHLRGS